MPERFRTSFLTDASLVCGRGRATGELTMLKIYAYVQTLRSNEEGAAAAEYALILAIIGTAIATASVVLGDAIGAVMTRASLKMAAILP